VISACGQPLLPRHNNYFASGNTLRLSNKQWVAVAHGVVEWEVIVVTYYIYSGLKKPINLAPKKQEKPISHCFAFFNTQDTSQKGAARDSYFATLFFLIFYFIFDNLF